MRLKIEDTNRIGRRRSSAPRHSSTSAGKSVLGRLGRARPRHAAPVFQPVGPALALRPRRRFDPRLLLMACGAAVLITALVLGSVAFFSRPKLVQAQEILFDGRSLGFAASADAVTQTLTNIESDLNKTYNMPVQLTQEVQFRPVRCEQRYLCTDGQIAQALKRSLDVNVVAAVIRVNDRPAVALRSQAEAQQALDDQLAPFRDAPASRQRTGIGFVEKVEVVQMPIDYSLVCTREQAAHTLAMGAGVEDNPYSVKGGDSLARIAKKFKLKVSDLRRANPEIASTDVIQPGQQINAVKPNKWLNVRFTDTVTREEALPFETVEQQDASLYTTQKQTKQEGKQGRREVVAKVTLINGMEAEKQIVSQTVLTPAVNKIVLRGTKAVPKDSEGSGSGSSGSGSGGSGSSSMFSFPLKSYRLTSTFKIRKLQGVTRWHYGMDLAAPTGTPIYAARAGTVNFSGSSSGYGLLVKISHDGGFESRYGHCSKLLVKKGQKVKKGQLIALVGSTGHSTGPHCHYELRKNGTPVDPKKYTK